MLLLRLRVADRHVAECQSGHFIRQHFSQAKPEEMSCVAAIGACNHIASDTPAIREDDRGTEAQLSESPAPIALLVFRSPTPSHSRGLVPGGA